MYMYMYMYIYSVTDDKANVHRVHVLYTVPTTLDSLDRGQCNAMPCTERID